jgi:hypothetical protein
VDLEFRGAQLAVDAAMLRAGVPVGAVTPTQPAVKVKVVAVLLVTVAVAVPIVIVAPT